MRAVRLPTRFRAALTVPALLYFFAAERAYAEASRPKPRPLPFRPSVSNGVIALGDVDRNGHYQIFTVSPDGSNRKQLTNDPGQNWMPAWSPDGKRLAYVSRFSGGMQIRVMNADGTNNQQLPIEGVSWVPSWSPEGTRIAYAHMDFPPPQNPHFNIWVINADGTGNKQLTTGNDDDNVPTWSPDGQKVAFTSNRAGGRYQIWVMDSDGTNFEALTTAYYDPGLAANIEQKVPAWSPDGSKIAYWSGVEGNDPRPNLPRDVWVMNADGSNQGRLTPGDDPAWSPDGRTILYPAFHDGRLAVGGISPDGSNQRILFLTNGGFGRASWQAVRDLPPPLGVENGQAACFGPDEAGAMQIFRFGPDGGDRKKLTAEGNNVYPSWSRDGSRILFASSRNGKPFEIWTMDADGRNQRPISSGTPLGGGNFTPFESGDGSRIAFTAVRPEVGHQEVWVMDADGGNARRVTTTPLAPAGRDLTWSVHPTWSADGKRIVYASTRSGSTQIWMMDSDGSNQAQITAGNGSNFPDSNVPEWSLDGERIVFWSGFERQYGEIWVMDADGKNKRQITETPDPMNSDNPHWSPDGTRILFASNRGETGTVDVWLVEAGGGVPRLFARNMGWCTWQPIRGLRESDLGAGK